MIDGFNLNEDFIQFEKEFSTWEEAVIKSSEPLLNMGYVEQSYIDAMINSVKEYGPYIVIAPNIAMPHARPESGSKKIGYSIMKLEKKVSFTEDGENDALLFIAISCVDANKHLELLQAIIAVLSDEEKHDKAFAAKTKEEMLAIFS